MPPSHSPSLTQLRQALKITEQIESLQKQLASLLGSTGAATTTSRQASAPKKRTRTVARSIAEKPAVLNRPVKATKKGGITPEGRAKLAAAMKARWAARQKGAPAPNASAA